MEETLQAEAQNLLRQNFFQLFEVSWDAPTAAVRKKFHALARKFHPDRNKTPLATDAFQHINEGLQTLTDATKRMAYLKTVRNAANPNQQKPQPNAAATNTARPQYRPDAAPARNRPTLDFIRCDACHQRYGMPRAAVEHHWCPMCSYFTSNACNQLVASVDGSCLKQCGGPVPIYSHKQQSQCRLCYQLYATKVDAPMGIMISGPPDRPPARPPPTRPAQAPAKSRSAGIRKSRESSKAMPPADAVQADGLPAGWLVASKTRGIGATAGQTDKYYFNASGRKFRSVAACKRYIEESQAPEELD